MNANITLWSPGLGDVQSQAVVSAALTPAAGRVIPLIDAVSDAGVPLTATATGGAMGISRTAGTSLQLLGEATSASAKTDKAAFAFVLPDAHIAGSAITVTVNAAVSGSGTLTAASTTLTVAVYTEVGGVETAISGVTSAQEIVAAGSNLIFTVPGAGLVAGQWITIELTMLVTSSSGANTGEINAVTIAC